MHRQTTEIHNRMATMGIGYVVYVLLLIFLMKFAYDFSSKIVDKIYQPYFENSYSSAADTNPS